MRWREGQKVRETEGDRRREIVEDEESEIEETNSDTELKRKKD